MEDASPPRLLTARTQEPYPSLLRTVGLLLATLIAAALLAVVAIKLFPHWPDIARMAVPTEIALAGAIAYAVWRTGLPWREALSFRPLEARAIAPLALIVLGSVTVFSELYVVIQRIAPVPEAIESMLRELLEMQGAADHLATLVIAVLVAPALEEMLFRGVLLQGLARRHGPHAASLWTATFFALFHIYNPWQIVPTFFLGLILAWLVLSTRTLIAAVVVHALFNSLSLALVEAPIGEAVPGERPELWFVVVIVLLLMAGSVALLVGLVWLEAQTGGGWFSEWRDDASLNGPDGDPSRRRSYEMAEEAGRPFKTTGRSATWVPPAPD